MSKRYQPVTDGEEVVIPHWCWKISCCDCHLVHVFKFRFEKGKLYIKVWRDARATAQKRRHAKKNT